MTTHQQALERNPIFHCRDCGREVPAVDRGPNPFGLGPLPGDCSHCLEFKTEQAKVAEKKLLCESYLKAGVPPRFIDKSFEDYNCNPAIVAQRKSFEVLYGYANNFELNVKKGQWLLCLGGPGCGKTHLAIAMVKTVIEKGFSAGYLRAFEFLSVVKDGYSKANRSTSHQLSFKAVDLLILDEVQDLFGTKAEQILLFDLLDNRYANSRPTVLISNLSFGELTELLDQRIMDRIFEVGKVLSFNWPSYRRRQRELNLNDSN